MNAMLLNLGLAPIPPTPFMPSAEQAVQRKKMYSDPNNAGIRAMREKVKAKAQASMQEMLVYMRKNKRGKSREMMKAMGWSNTKVVYVLNTLQAQGKVRKHAAGAQSYWEYVDAGN